MEFNKKEFEDFRNDFKLAMKSLEEKYEVEIETGNISYSDLDFRMNIQVVKAHDGIDVEKIQFERDCVLYGFKPEHYKQTFQLDGKEFELIGFNRTKPKNNCNINEVATKKRYQANDKLIKGAMKI